MRFEIPDIIIPIKEGAVSDQIVKGDFSDILSEGFNCRHTNQDEIVTVFKSLGMLFGFACVFYIFVAGMAIEDVGVAQFLYEKCVANKTGVWVDF